MLNQSKYITTILAILSILIISGCTRELTSGDERPQQPFNFDRIPALTGQPGDTSPVQLSNGETEPIDGTGETAVADTGDGPVDDPAIEALLNGGRNALIQGDLDLAIEYFESVIEQDENNIKALFNLGLTYRKKGDADKAVEFSLRAVEVDPDRLYVHQNLAFAYEAQGNEDGMIAELENELNRHPDEPSLSGIAVRLAAIYLERDLHQEAFDAAIRAVQLEPDAAFHHAMLADVHMHNAAYPQAIESYEKAVSLDPDFALHRKYLADALWAAGREDDARLEYGKALEMDPELADTIDPDRLPDNAASDDSDNPDSEDFDSPM